jgi:hypothetical protein
MQKLVTKETVETAKQIILPHSWRKEAIRWVPVLVVAILLAYLYGDYRSKPEAPTVLGPYSTAQVTTRVEGIEGPAVKLGETVNINIEACSKAMAKVETQVYLRRLRNGGPTQERQLVAFTTDRIVACSPLNLNFIIARELGPGKYTFFGVDTVLDSKERLVWSSEEFEVVQ